jgi:Putative 2OG-Fe(II) oxygenase
MSDKRWIRSGNDNLRIASVALSDYQEFATAVKPLFKSGTVPYSGIILTDESNYEGEVIEKSSYKSGGLVFLYRAYRQPVSEIPDFPTDKLKSLIEAIGRSYLREVDKKNTVVSLEACWAVCQRAGDYGTLHNHVPPNYTGKTRYSGIFYLLCPRSINPTTFPNGCIHIVAERAVLYFPPIPGTFIIWPSELLHGIHPFRGRGERHAIAFDFVVSSN